jgi:hypothetical protein
MLPDPTAGGDNAKRGSESRSSLSPSFLTALSDRAAERNNEMQPSQSL